MAYSGAQRKTRSPIPARCTSINWLTPAPNEKLSHSFQQRVSRLAYSGIQLITKPPDKITTSSNALGASDGGKKWCRQKKKKKKNTMTGIDRPKTQRFGRGVGRFWCPDRNARTYIHDTGRSMTLRACVCVDCCALLTPVHIIS